MWVGPGLICAVPWSRCPLQPGKRRNNRPIEMSPPLMNWSYSEQTDSQTRSHSNGIENATKYEITTRPDTGRNYRVLNVLYAQFNLRFACPAAQVGLRGFWHPPSFCSELRLKDQWKSWMLPAEKASFVGLRLGTAYYYQALPGEAGKGFVQNASYRGSGVLSLWCMETRERDTMSTAA